MSKKRLLIILASVLVLAGSFIVVLHNVSKLPPEVVMPNSKPASSNPSYKTAMTVNAAPAEQAVSVASSISDTDSSSTASAASTAKPTVAQCDQPAVGSTQAAKPVVTPSSILSSVVAGTQDSAKKIVLDSVSQLGSTLENVTGGLSQ